MKCPICKKEVANNELLKTIKFIDNVLVGDDMVGLYSATCPECGGTVYLESVPKFSYNGRGFLEFERKKQQQ